MDNEFVNNFIAKIGRDEESFARFFAALRGGENNISHTALTQTLTLDDSWVLTIESALNSIEQIARNPHKFIAENELILDVAKVRRTNHKTVRHLSSHSEFVQNIDERTGEVTPKKLLTFALDEDIAIYENRFVCSLVNRLLQFVEIRNDDLSAKMDTFLQTNVNMDSTFKYGSGEFRCKIDLQVKEPIPGTSDNDVERNQDLFERVQTIRRRIRVLKNTEFIKALDKAKPVRPPIQKTNLLTKNVDYNNCYKLWLFISSYTYLGYSVAVKDKNLPVDGDYYDDLSVIAGLSLQTLISDGALNKKLYENIPFSKPVEKDFNLVTSLDYKPEFEDSRQDASDETINEYYFKRMKGELTKAAQEGDVPVEKRLQVNFMKFFRSVSRINDEMYSDLIEEQLKADEELSDSIKSPLSKKKREIARQKERIKRRKLYLKLKWEEVERAQRMCERAQDKLDKLKADYAEEKHKQKSGRLVKVKFSSKPKKDKHDKDSE